MLLIKAEACPKRIHPKSVFPVLPANIMLGWNDVISINTLAYFKIVKLNILRNALRLNLPKQFFAKFANLKISWSLALLPLSNVCERVWVLALNNLASWQNALAYSSNYITNFFYDISPKVAPSVIKHFVLFTLFRTKLDSLPLVQLSLIFEGNDNSDVKEWLSDAPLRWAFLGCKMFCSTKTL